MKLSTLRRTGILLGLAMVAAITLAAPAVAQQAEDTSGLGLKGIGVRLGLADPEDASSALTMGVHIDAGTLVRNVHVVPSVEYWNVGNDVGPYNTDFSDLAFRLGINFDFPLQDQRMVPYLGGGIGIHRFSFDTNVPNIDDDSRTKIGLDVQGGARNQFTPNLSMFGELGYSFVSDANTLRLIGGLTYHFIY
ncbi:MAG TPA: outer membrane beta-barrel protein [Candidatus Eisenbacteria bacterium]